MYLTKAQTWALADDLGALDYVRAHTHTCYMGVAGGCGRCPAACCASAGWRNIWHKKALEKARWRAFWIVGSKPDNDGNGKCISKCISMNKVMQPAVYIMASQRNGTLYIGVTSNLIQPFTNIEIIKWQDLPTVIKYPCWFGMNCTRIWKVRLAAKSN